MKTIPRRRIWIVPREQPLKCPHEAGHRMREDALIPEHGMLRCKAKLAAGGYQQPSAECGTWLYVARMEKDRRLVAEVTYDEARHIETQGMDVDQALAFLEVIGALRREG